MFEQLTPGKARSLRRLIVTNQPEVADGEPNASAYHRSAYLGGDCNRPTLRSAGSLLTPSQKAANFLTNVTQEAAAN